ncbi:MAG: molybdenum cofactor biosynthesis protein [Desulfobacterales bacterium]|nr:molybdenum cofactor biosynthesis protein [Desulfobacterales bacterium]
MSTKEHKKHAPKKVRIGIVTVSTTRTLDTDKSGHWMRKRARKEGHEVVLHRVVPDDSAFITKVVLEAIHDPRPDALLLTGGTGVAKKDVTIEAVRPLFKKELSAFGVLFTMLSFEEIDSAALLSRAAAGLIEDTFLFCMPGSLNACKLACKALIFPELGHLVAHARE